MYYGILSQATNTGLRSELACEFATPLVIATNEPELVSDTVSLKRVGATTGHQRWEITAAIAQTKEATPLMLSLTRAGRSRDILIRMPAMLDAEVDGVAPVQLTANVAPGATSITVSSSVNLKPGVFFQFQGHPKVYMVDNRVGNVLTVYPRVRDFFVAGTVLNYGARTTLRAKVDDNIVGVKYENGILVEQGSYKFVEAL
jgi:hypothetical protein